MKLKLKQNGFELIEVMIIVAVIGALAAVVVPTVIKVVGISTVYSVGERTGVLTKLSKKGFFWKTWEGELNLGGMSDHGGGTAVPNVWRFSVADAEVVQQLLPAARGAKRVTLKYTEVWKASFAQGQTDYFITDVRAE